VPPGYTGELPGSGYFVHKMRTTRATMLGRSFLQNNDPKPVVALKPTARSEKHVVPVPERRGRACDGERRPLGTREADDELGPCRRIVRIDGPRAQFALDHVDAHAHDVRRDRSPYDEEAVRTELVNGCRPLADRAACLKQAADRTRI